ncbi:MAG: hypothetical protein ABL921_19230 [Pirellula sp.]
MIRRSRDRVWEHRLVWLLLFAILGLWGYFHLVGRVDSKLTTEILKHVRKEFPGHLVFIDRAHLIPGQSITIEGIRIAKPTDQGLRDVLRCGRVLCSGPIELIGLAQGQLPVEKVVADGVEVCVWPLTDGRFSVQELSSNKPISPSLPSIEVRSGLVRIGSETGRAEQEIICHDLRASVCLSPRLVSGRIAPLSAAVVASVSSSYFNHVSLNATLSQDKASWVAQGRVVKLEYSPRLASQLPSVLQQYLSNADGFSGELHGDFAVRSDRGKLSFKAKSKIQNGRLLHPKLPYPLESLSGEVDCENGLLHLRNIQASSGNTRIACHCDVYGFTISSPLRASLSVQDLSLDQRLYLALPLSVQETWRKLGVSGVVDASAMLEFDGQRWTPRVIVRAKDAGVEADYFPYPVKRVSGDFVYQNDSIVATNLMGTAAGQTLRGELVLTKASPRWLMDLKLAADGPIPIDETLLRSLSPRDTPQSSLHKFILSLHPTGTLLLKKGHFARTSDRPDSISKTIELTFSECSIKYDMFRYPIEDIHGEATLDDEHLLLRNFVGRNDGGRIKGQGVCQCKNSVLESMQLDFDGHNVALDEELQQALPLSIRGLWDQLQPSGVLDQVWVSINRQDSFNPLDLRVEIKENQEKESQAGRSVSVRPISLPYQVNDIACNIVYRPGRIDINSLSGLHDASRLQTEGQCRLHADGTWDGVLTWLPLTRLMVDQSLLNCLPSYLRTPMVRVDFRGPVSITGTTRVASPMAADESIVRAWDLELQVEDGRLGGGGIASGIRGSISLAGKNTNAGPMAFGTLNLDSLLVKNIAVTGMVGPFAFNRNELLLGRDASSWQMSQNLPVPSFQERPPTHVVSANYLAPNQRSTSVSSATYRSTLHDSLSNRPRLMNRNVPVPPPDPNAVRPNKDIPYLDTRETDIKARSLSGTVFISGVEPLDAQQRARYRLRLVDANLDGFLVDLGESSTNAVGQLSVQCDLQGALTNTAALEGQGRVWLRDANLYELPAMIRLFRMLSIKPGQGAFDSADVLFGIDGERIPIQDLTLDGDIVSMRGTGWVNVRRELHLDLFANVGRRGIVGALFHPLNQTSAGKLWQIEVNGTTSDPQIRRPMALINPIDRVLPASESEAANR